MLITARSASESAAIIKLDKDARFINLRDAKADIVEAPVAGLGQMVHFKRSKSGKTWHANYADTDITVSFPGNACSIEMKSGPRSTRKIATTGLHDNIGIDLRYLLAGYGAPIGASMIQAMVARHGLVVIGRAAGERQLSTFREFLDSAPSSINVNGDTYTQNNHVSTMYEKDFGKFKISIRFDRPDLDQKSDVVTHVSIDEDHVSRGLAAAKFDLLRRQRSFDNVELKEAFKFINETVDAETIKHLVDELRAEQLARTRKRAAQRRESKTWPEAIAINGMMLWRVKASRNYSDSNHSAPSISDKSLWLDTRSVFYVKYASPRVLQDGKRVSSVQLHIAPENGDVIIGLRGPRTNSVTVRDGISKVRSMKTHVPVDLQAVINKAASFLLNWMQKRNLTTETSPSAYIIKRGSEIDV